MFEKYMIVPEGAANIHHGESTTGFRFGARLPYYRGLGLSMVEDIQVRVDDEPVATDKIRLTVHGNTYSLAEMETEANDRWEMGEVATISVDHPGGLSAGQHTLNLLINLRISYLPFPAIRQAEGVIKIGS